MMSFRMQAIASAIFAVWAYPVFAEGSDVGQINWDTGTAPLHEAQCGFSGETFVMSALSDDVRLRLAFPSSGTVESVDFLGLSSVELSFTDAHELSGQSFGQYRSRGDMGEVSASPEGATGTLSLRPASVDALDAHPDGLQISYRFTCSGALF